MFRRLRLIADMHVSAALYIPRYMMTHIHPHAIALTRRMRDNTRGHQRIQACAESHRAERSNDHEESEFCNIAKSPNLTLHRVLNNTEVKERIYVYILCHTYRGLPEVNGGNKNRIFTVEKRISVFIGRTIFFTSDNLSYQHFDRLYGFSH